ncbi:glycosyltransferase family 1 protein [Candidatus Phycosocius bacilliformis]|uniref:glycosyltransferase family 1 protein n=1 Tax=Candidatus Phycosocius bacilliformis TaxID=1445552 RepID=UPI001057A6B7|nr:glycosyltransferase family 1 protein [Candidatus Phycosocius bacilliformis]
MKPRLFLVDPYLRSGLGHTADLARLYLDLAEGDGLAPVIVLPAGSQMRDAFGDYRVDMLAPDPGEAIRPPDHPNTSRHTDRLPHFLRTAIRRVSRHWFGDRAHENFLIEQSTQLSDKVQDWFATIDFHPRDHLFFPTLSWAEAMRVAEAFEAHLRRRPVVDVQCSLMLRFDPPRYSKGRRFMARKAPFSPQIHFVSDTRQLAEAYSTILNKKVSQILIPIEPTLVSGETSQAKRRPARIAFLGESRTEKRFDKLPEIIEAFRSLKTQEPVQFYVQHAPVASQDQAKLAKVADRLRAMQDDDLVVVSGTHSTEEFIALLKSASVVLAPYRVANYRRRSSGLVIGALAAGAVVVAEAGRSWLSSSIDKDEQTKRLSLFHGGSAKQIARAIAKALQLKDEIHTGYQFPPQPKPWPEPGIMPPTSDL